MARVTGMLTTAMAVLAIAASDISQALAAGAADAVAPLQIEAKIPLGDIKGRLDHLAFDPRRRRLYVAELGNHSIGIVDLAARRVIRTVSGFDEPQGIGYEPSTDTIYVANGGDGSVRIFRGDDFAALGQIALGDDADNVRIDPVARRVYVGYGSGGLAIIDANTRTKIASIPLKAHPEGFQLGPHGLAFVNIPDAGHIAVVDLESHRQSASWPTGELKANFPIALDAGSRRIIAVFRRPARLQAFAMRTGEPIAGSEVCGDCDDVFVDPKRHRIYVICGEGFVDTLDDSANEYRRIGRLATSEGSRTGLFIPALDRLLIAIRASRKEPAAIWLATPPP